MTTFEVFAWMGWGAFVAQLVITLVWMRRALVTKRRLDFLYERYSMASPQDAKRRQCIQVDSDGVRCELEEDHPPPCACSKALKEFLEMKEK